MIIETLEVAGIRPAMRAMRNPWDSWSRSDSCLSDQDGYIVGKNDAELSRSLSDAGTEHCKHLRLIDVWADVTASLKFYSQLDTYRMGVDKVSCSTMHTITRKEFVPEMFEVPDQVSINHMNMLRDAWWNAKQDGNNQGMEFYKNQLLYSIPSSFLQTRTYKFSYAALAAMYQQRKNHRLPEWHIFCDWIRCLPYSFLIIPELPVPEDLDKTAGEES